MKKSLLFRLSVTLLTLSFCTLCFGKDITLTHLSTEYKTNPLGVAAKQPRLSWKIAATDRAVIQTAFQVRAAASEKDLKAGKNLVWDSGKTASDQSVHIPYSGKALQSRDKVYWQVKVWTSQGESAWSSISSFEMGLLNPSDWIASWIEADIMEDIEESSPSPYLRKEFTVKKEIKSARVYTSAQGLYQLHLNGSKVSDELFTPGWTSYHKRIQYQVYDVTSQLKQGGNAIGVILGDGWYRGTLKWRKQRNHFGDKLRAIVQLEIIYSDGSKETVVSDNSWKSSTGPILTSDIYNGESYDARLEMKGWDVPHFHDSGWSGVLTKETDKKLLVNSESVPVRITQTIKPIAKIITPKNELVLDFGQNFVGWVEFNLKGEAGDQIQLNFAEVLDKEGNFYTTNLRTAKAEDTYIFKGEGVEKYEPHFTFHGFRYLKISGYKGEVTLDNFMGKVVTSDVATIGNFNCSDTLINRLQENIRWGLWSNFLDVPTDCPQRDERLGWTGDIQAFSPTACFNVHAATFLTKWLKDLSADQLENGSVTHYVPAVKTGHGAAGWADAAVIVPWEVYSAYGDKGILETQYPSMKGWVDFLKQSANDYLVADHGDNFGDWLAYAPALRDYPGATTDKDLIATAFFAYSTKLLAQTAEVLDKQNDAKAYSELYENIQKAFQKEYMTSTGRLSSNTQTAYALALAFDLIPDNLKANSAKRLADDVRSFGHITTGFLGTPLINNVLSKYGYDEEAYTLLFRKQYPSWLYPVTMGATTIWEHWDGINPDGTFHSPNMNSFNHYAYGAIGNWLYTHVAGISQAPNSAGYKKIVINPVPDKNILQYAEASYHSVYGKILSRWEKKDGYFNLKVVIPANTTAIIHLPTQTATNITEAGKPLNKVKGILNTETIKEKVLLEVGSGEYSFSVPL